MFISFLFYSVQGLQFTAFQDFEAEEWLAHYFLFSAELLCSNFNFTICRYCTMYIPHMVIIWFKLFLENLSIQNQWVRPNQIYVLEILIPNSIFSLYESSFTIGPKVAILIWRVIFWISHSWSWTVQIISNTKAF